MSKSHAETRKRRKCFYFGRLRSGVTDSAVLAILSVKLILMALSAGGVARHLWLRGVRVPLVTLSAGNRFVRLLIVGITITGSAPCGWPTRGQSRIRK